MWRVFAMLAALYCGGVAGWSWAANGKWAPERFVEIVAGSGARGAQDCTARQFTVAGQTPETRVRMERLRRGETIA